MAITTKRVDELPIAAIAGTNLIPHETVNDLQLKQATFAQLKAFILGNDGENIILRKGMSTTLNETETFIEDNFNLADPSSDTYGLGINLMDGWAIKNGKNGTTNLKGRFSMGWDNVAYPNLGTTGGSKDAVVVAHSHTVAANPSKAGSGFLAFESNSVAGSVTTSTTGESGVNKNLPPYLVELHIERVTDLIANSGAGGSQTLQEVMELGRTYSETVGDYEYSFGFTANSFGGFILNNLTGDLVEFEWTDVGTFTSTSNGTTISSTQTSLVGAYSHLLSAVNSFGENVLRIPYKTSGSGGAIFELPNNKPDGTYTLATTDDIPSGSSTIVVDANKTAVNDESYSNVANATYTDPTPVEGKGYNVKVVNGTATIGGVGYAVGNIVTRTYHSGSWRSKAYIDKSIIDSLYIPKSKFITQGYTQLTGVTGVNVLASVLIPANTYASGQSFEIVLTPNKSITASSLSFHLFHDTVINGNTNTIASGTFLSATSRSGYILRVIVIDGTTARNSMTQTSTSLTPIAVGITSTFTFNPDEDNYITLTVNPTNTSEVTGFNNFSIRPL